MFPESQLWCTKDAVWTTTTACQAAAQPSCTSTSPRARTHFLVPRTLTWQAGFWGPWLHCICSVYLRNTDPDLRYSAAHLSRQSVDGFQSCWLDTGTERHIFAVSFEVKSTPTCLALCKSHFLQPQRFSSSAPLTSTSLSFRRGWLVSETFPIPQTYFLLNYFKPWSFAQVKYLELKFCLYVHVEARGLPQMGPMFSPPWPSFQSRLV